MLPPDGWRLEAELDSPASNKTSSPPQARRVVRLSDSPLTRNHAVDAVNDQIKNRVARELCFIGSENKMKGILQRLVKKGLIELVPGTTRYSAAYRLKKKKAQQ